MEVRESQGKKFRFEKINDTFLAQFCCCWKCHEMQRKMDFFGFGPKLMILHFGLKMLIFIPLKGLV